MRPNRRRSVLEINLTPLLDVLFSILFIVMMAGMQNEEGMKEDYQQQIDRLEQEKAGLSEQLDNYRDQMDNFREYQKEMILLTVRNVVRGDDHYLLIYQGAEPDEIESIQMGTDRTENTRARIESLVSGYAEREEGYPVYIVFNCDKSRIYTAEYRAVIEAFNAMQGTYKAVFFKVMEEKR